MTEVRRHSPNFPKNEVMQVFFDYSKISMNIQNFALISTPSLTGYGLEVLVQPFCFHFYYFLPCYFRFYAFLSRLQIYRGKYTGQVTTYKY